MKTSNSYKAIIFDLGKVVFDLSFDRTFQYWANISGKQFNDIKDNFSFDSIFDKFERDEITCAEFRKSLSQKLGISISDQLFDEGWCNLYLDPYPEINRLLMKLKLNYRVVALTNTNKIHETVWKAKYSPVLQHFEKVFSSSDMKTRKPEARSFQIVLDHLQLKPQETLFLDDNEDNIKGAEKLGIRSILVSSPGQMVNDLSKIVNL